MGLGWGWGAVPVRAQSGCRAIVSGVDTLHISSSAPLREDVVANLTVLRQQAVARGDREAVMCTVGRQDFRVLGHGAKNATFVLANDYVTFKLQPRAPEPLPTLTAELRSLFLWQQGAFDAIAEAEEMVSHMVEWDTLGGRVPQRIRVSRCDLTVDFQGWIPRAEDEARFIRRARKIDIHHDGNRFSGFSFGRGHISARLYDKTLEIEGSDKTWFRELWRTSAPTVFDPAAPVWRLEYQLRRAGLRGFENEDAAAEGQVRRGPPILDQPNDVFASARQLWVYLCEEWLSLREPRTETSRKILTPEWQALADQGFTAPQWNTCPANLVRIAHKSRGRRNAAHLTGYVARVCADEAIFKSGVFDRSRAVEVLVQAVEEYCASSDRPFEQRVAEFARDGRTRMAPFAGPLPWGAAPRPVPPPDSTSLASSEGFDAE